MASMRDIKRRKSSIQSTQQITKAMKLVSTVKLQKAKTNAENSKSYFDYMYDTVTSILAKSGNINHPGILLLFGGNVSIAQWKSYPNTASEMLRVFAEHTFFPLANQKSFV